jgi:hypothetical protein
VLPVRPLILGKIFLRLAARAHGRNVIKSLWYKDLRCARDAKKCAGAARAHGRKRSEV